MPNFRKLSCGVSKILQKTHSPRGRMPRGRGRTFGSNRRYESYNRGEQSSSTKPGIPKVSFDDSNAIGADGNRLKCFVCQSTKQFAARCPYSRRRTEEANVTTDRFKPVEDVQMSINITLCTGKGDVA
jgi:hypothetical protein